MSDLKSKPQHVAHLARSSFPMGNSFVYTSSVGMILPIYSDWVNVGESLYINGSLMVRSQPLVTAALCDISLDVDWFFVPISKLFTLFPSLRYMTNDPISDFYSGLYGDNHATDMGLPLFDLDQHLYGNGPGTAEDVGDQTYLDGLSSRFGSQSCNAYRLADMLDYNPDAVLFESGENVGFNPNVFPWRALAYQCIYQDYFRNDMYEKKNVRSYNVDSLYASSNPDVSYRHRDLFYLRFRQRHADYFNITRPQPYLSAVNLIGDSNSVLGQNDALSNLIHNSGVSWMTPSMSSGEVTNGLENADGGIAGTLGDVGSGHGFASIYNISNTQTLRLSFAQEKLLRIIGMSKKDYDSQVLAHFGFHVPHDVKHEITHLFRQHGIMHIGEVLSTADTFNSTSKDGRALGSVGGKGYGYVKPYGASDKNPQGHSYKFTAPVDGILMAVSSFVPDVYYSGLFDKQNAMAYVADLYTPEFDKLGSQPLFAYESRRFMRTKGSQAALYSKILGWQYRYQQWKMKYNRATVAFISPNLDKNEVNVYSPWVETVNPLGYRNDESSFARPLFENFLCTPHDIDNIMIVPYNGVYSSDFDSAPWLIYQTDPFICAFNSDVKKVSTMSPTGEPDLGQI